MTPKPAPRRPSVVLFDGYRYTIHADNTVWGQVRQGERTMSPVVEPQIAALVRTALAEKGGA